MATSIDSTAGPSYKPNAVDTQEQFRLLDLPREIRDIINDCALFEEEEIQTMYDKYGKVRPRAYWQYWDSWNELVEGIPGPNPKLFQYKGDALPQSAKTSIALQLCCRQVYGELHERFLRENNSHKAEEYKLNLWDHDHDMTMSWLSLPAPRRYCRRLRVTVHNASDTNRTGWFISSDCLLRPKRVAFVMKTLERVTWRTWGSASTQTDSGFPAQSNLDLLTLALSQPSNDERRRFRRLKHPSDYGFETIPEWNFMTETWPCSEDDEELLIYPPTTGTELSITRQKDTKLATNALWKEFGPLVNSIRPRHLPDVLRFEFATLGWQWSKAELQCYQRYGFRTPDPS
ncbi:MAG: hypothetical protein M1828_003866 [Chrysothrix sp. TS-e1954]|nr:MAG: hypothetical protein M1828_003866 [Chrysothrix sp. TS-e1954]